MTPTDIETIEEASCSFCHKKSSEVRVLIKSPREDKMICDECVKLIKKAFDNPRY
jgi:ATP-dependent protease Clp ATPase subunit